jgi:hypothetical protein
MLRREKRVEDTYAQEVREGRSEIFKGIFGHQLSLFASLSIIPLQRSSITIHLIQDLGICALFNKC